MGEFRPYPKALYHPQLGETLVLTPEHEAELGAGWFATPTAMLEALAAPVAEPTPAPEPDPSADETDPPKTEEPTKTTGTRGGRVRGSGK